MCTTYVTCRYTCAMCRFFGRIFFADYSEKGGEWGKRGIPPNHIRILTPGVRKCVFQYGNQRCQPPIFSPIICAKSQSNPKCLRKNLHQTNPKRRVFAMKPVLRQKRVFSTKPFSWQKRVFVELQPGHVIIGMIPATLSMQKTMHMTIIRLLT